MWFRDSTEGTLSENSVFGFEDFFEKIFRKSSGHCLVKFFFFNLR